jgi:hypothetical protein
VLENSPIASYFFFVEKNEAISGYDLCSCSGE